MQIEGASSSRPEIGIGAAAAPDKTQEEEKKDAHSYDGFNFAIFFGLLFYRLLRFFGMKKTNKKLHPYYVSLLQIRRQLDLRKILQRFLYLERAITCLLPKHLHKLLFYFSKEDILHLDTMR